MELLRKKLEGRLAPDQIELLAAEILALEDGWEEMDVWDTAIRIFAPASAGWRPRRSRDRYSNYSV